MTDDRHNLILLLLLLMVGHGTGEYGTPPSVRRRLRGRRCFEPSGGELDPGSFGAMDESIDPRGGGEGAARLD